MTPRGRPSPGSTALMVSGGLTLLLAVCGATPFIAQTLLGAGAKWEWAKAAVTFVAMGVGGLTVSGSIVWLMVRTLREPDDPAVRCETCGYDLRGNVSALCPECGAACPRVETTDERPAQPVQ
ncbi:MAG: hypothetical protein J0L61_09005 [Planctomycetes bacterium]|nr:hypothetical protein [Planctomycetota bacterium]